MNNVYAFADRETIEAEARKWLIRFDGDGPFAPEDIAALREWVGRSTAHREELQRIAAFWGDADVLVELAILLKKTEKHSRPSIWGRLVDWLLPFSRPGALVGVSLLGVAVALMLWFQLLPSLNNTYTTAVGELQVQTLADGSVMHINTDSQVQVDYSENVRKIHLLRGEAYFTVSKDTERPFEVYAGESMIKAVGTAFSVRLNDQQLKVIVTEGRVDLAALASEQPLLQGGNAVINDDKEAENHRQPQRLKKLASLDRGQSATLSNLTGTGKKASDPRPVAEQLQVESLQELELARRVAWREGYLVFSGDPLSDVIKEINRYTSVVIEITDPALDELRVGGRFQVGELEALYNVLEVSFGIQVSRLSDQHIQLRSRQG